MASCQQALLCAGSGSSVTYLDSLATTPRCVLSLRKLISTATNCIRIRRSSDNTEQDIGFSGNSVDTAAISSFVGSNSAFVVTWYDQTGNAEHANQATAANQPRIVNAGVYDGKLVFDGTNDSLMITSLTMGSQYAAAYFKSRITSSGTNIIFEQSTNYNVNSQSFVIFRDTPTGGPLFSASRNSTSASDFRNQAFPATLNPGSLAQFSVLLDRSTSGTAEIQAFQGGSQLSATVIGTPAEQTGNYSSYDLYIGARAGTSLFNAMELETAVFYNANTSSQRTSVEALVA